jgi:hypothetical protein
MRALVFLLAISSGLMLVALNRPNAHGLGHLCPSKRFLDIECPGCGSTRAIHHVSRGRIDEAFAHNPLLVVVGLPVLGFITVSLAMASTIGVRPRFYVNGRWAMFAAIGLVLYLVLRNLPFESLDFLRPPPLVSREE